MRAVSIFFISFLFFSCNNNGKDSVEAADSANRAKLDSGLKKNQVVIDENSSAFLVRAASLSIQLKLLAESIRETATNPTNKSFANSLSSDYKTLNDSIVALASRKNIVLPEDSGKLNAEIKKANISLLVEAQEKAMSLFDNAILDAKDPDIRSFADKSIPLLKKNLEWAKKLDKEL